jgi:glycosyltransferase involved in cell wall biosynthesis
LNQLASVLKRLSPDSDVHFIGRNRLHLYGNPGEILDPRLVHIHPAVDETEAWQYILHAHAGLALAPGGEAFESELAKIYYYLRGGLPVVTESSVLNRFLIDETGHGAVAAYGNIQELAEKIMATLELPSRNSRVMNYMAETHSWRRRAEIYLDALHRWKETPVEEAIP